MFESFKPYKKINYDEAESKAVDASSKANAEGREVFTPAMGLDGKVFKEGTVGHERGEWTESAEGRRERKALDKLEILKNKAHSEGLELETKHDKLTENLRNAQEELNQFRQNELGLSEHSEVETEEVK